MEPQSIAENLFFSTVRLETITPQGMCAGTAFFFHFVKETIKKEKISSVFLVTNKHVIDRATRGLFFLHLRDGNTPLQGPGSKPLLGQTVSIEFQDFAAYWHGHPDPDVDIAVMRAVPVFQEVEETTGQKVFFRSIFNNLIPTSEELAKVDAIEEVIFIGYPNGIFDQKHFLPIARRGTTATPVQIDYDGKPRFLIDASVFGGSSGSPVLICNQGGFSVKGGFAVGTRVHFLGVVSAVLFREEFNHLQFKPIPAVQIPGVKTKEMLDLGVVFKSSTVVETVVDFYTMNGIEVG